MNAKPLQYSSDLTLSTVKPGERCKVIKILGTPDMRKKFLELGILPGCYIEVLSGRKNHPYLIRQDQTRIMLGTGMSDSVAIEIEHA